jgi:TPR repeat protein
MSDTNFLKFILAGLAATGTFNQGSATARSNSEIQFRNGRGLPQAALTTVEWYRKAANQGLAQAQCKLGFAYYKGEGVPKDLAKAVEWCRKAADQDFGPARDALLWMPGGLDK